MKNKEFTLKNGATVEVRLAAESDADAVAKFFSVLMEDGTGMVTTFEEFQHTLGDVGKWIRGLNEAENSILLIACAGKDIVANIDLKGRRQKSLRHQGSVGMGVHPDWRGQGLGGILMDLMLAWARENSILEKVCLDVRADNPAGIGLYRSRGFLDEGRHAKEVKLDANEYVDSLRMFTWV